MGKKNSPCKVVAATKALWVEALSMRKMDNTNKEPLTNAERTWASNFLGALPLSIGLNQGKTPNLKVGMLE